MEQRELKDLVNEWQNITHTVLELKEVPYKKTQVLLSKTYEVLSAFCKDDLVPKSITELFLEIGDFLYFAFLMEEKEVGGDYYQYKKINAVVKALKKGFFAGKYECEFPKLQLIDDNGKVFTFDIKSDCLNDLVI